MGEAHMVSASLGDRGTMIDTRPGVHEVGTDPNGTINDRFVAAEAAASSDFPVRCSTRLARAHFHQPTTSQE
jgi:hypothetical protein